MAKFYGEIGYAELVETSPGVWEEQISTKRNYCGDLIRNSRRLQASDSLNDNVNISNEISIVADPFAYQNSGTGPLQTQRIPTLRLRSWKSRMLPAPEKKATGQRSVFHYHLIIRPGKNPQPHTKSRSAYEEWCPIRGLQYKKH